MPYVRIGRTVYKKVGGRLIKKGTSETVEMAKRYMRKLYQVETQEREGRRRRKLKVKRRR